MIEAIKQDGWKLVDDNNNPVLKGSGHATFRGELMYVTGGRPPHKPSSTGRIHAAGGEYFPSVCNLRWVEER